MCLKAEENRLRDGMSKITLNLWLLLLESVKSVNQYLVKIPHSQKEFKKQDNEERINNCKRNAIPQTTSADGSN